MHLVHLLAQAQSQPLKMPAIQWPVSPWLIVAPAFGLMAVCLTLMFIAWRYKLPWLLKVVELLLPEEEAPKRRRRQGRRGW